MTDIPETSALRLLVEGIERELHVRRRDIASRLLPIEAALAAYRRALEEAAATDYAASHGFKRPSLAGVSPGQAAQNLLSAVQSLAELRRSDSTTMPRTAASAAPPSSLRGAPSQPPLELDERTKGGRVSALTSSAPNLEGQLTGEEVKPLASALPFVAAACDQKKLVIVGALAKRRRPLPDPLEQATEWIDTGDGGAHAVGNLPARIRQGRIFGVIICEQAISHKHSEPLMASARGANVPLGFAGKGGGASIARALKAIEEQLHQTAQS